MSKDLTDDMEVTNGVVDSWVGSTSRNPLMILLDSKTK